MIEQLESRIAPAAVLHFTDSDGDKVTVSTSKGTKADLTAACLQSSIGLSVDLIATADMAQHFSGTNLTIAVKKAAGGNGSVEVTRIRASDAGGPNDINLGVVSIAGNLGGIGVGTNDALIPAVKSLTVGSITDSVIQSQIFGKASTVTVRHDVTGYFTAGTVGKFVIGGSVLGGSTGNAGRISATNINTMTIAGDVHGGSAAFTGSVYADNTLGSITVKGSIIGGTASSAGNVVARIIGKAVVGGDVQGGSGDSSGAFSSGEIFCNTFTSIVVKGSLIGGSGAESGAIKANGVVANGSLSIGKNVTGGTNSLSGSINVDASVISLIIAGKLDGNNQTSDKLAGAILCPNITKLAVGQFLNGAQIVP